VPALASTPSYHQELYLLPEMQDEIHAWLRGDHARHGDVLEPNQIHRDTPTFVDLTPRHLAGQLSVAKAIAEDELTLTFGQGHPRLKPAFANTFPAHPIA
jgi:hypothetical protein